MLQNIVKPNERISEEELNSFASLHKLELPNEYRNFLLQTNGGQPTPASFRIEGFLNNPVGVVQVFFGLNAKAETEDIDSVLTDLGKNVPHGILPFACTEGDDFLILNLRRPEGPVIFWDRRQFWGSEVWDDRDTYRVADNFATFLNELF